MCRWWRVFNPFSVANEKKIETLMESIAQDVGVIRDSHIEHRRNLIKYREMLCHEKEEREREQRLFVSVLDHLEDLVWAKTVDGKYIMANKAFREKFCYGMEWEELQGKTDPEIAKIFKEKVGNENHTFGEVCSNSDEVIIETRKAREFLEHGNIDGKLMKLVVNKSPLYDEEGVMFATCGSGRDVTWLHNKLENVAQNCVECESQGFDLLDNVFKSIEFKEGDHVKRVG